MAILEEPFYHKSITLLTGVFGSVFDEIKVVRKDGKVILVPIAHQVKRRSTVRNNENPNPNSARYRNILPRMSFKLTGLQKDPNRILSRYQKLSNQTVNREESDTVKTQYNRVPYNFQYQLAIKTKTMDEMLQILEQIVVYFNPSIRVTVLDNPDLDQSSAITIRLLDETIDEIFEGSFDSEESLETTLNFELEGWLYMPTTDGKIIKTVKINYHDIDFDRLLEQDVVEAENE